MSNVTPTNNVTPVNNALISTNVEEVRSNLAEISNIGVTILNNTQSSDSEKNLDNNKFTAELDIGSSASATANKVGGFSESSQLIADLLMESSEGTNSPATENINNSSPLSFPLSTNVFEEPSVTQSNISLQPGVLDTETSQTPSSQPEVVAKPLQQAPQSTASQQPVSPLTLATQPNGSEQTPQALQPILANVPNVVVSPVPQQPTIDLPSIQQKAGNLDPNKSTQEILCDIAKDLEKLYPNAQIEIDSGLVQDANGVYDQESYTLPQEPNKTFYKAKVSYTFKVFKDGLEVKVDISLQREVFTTATIPENALVAALEFAKTNSKLGLAKANPQKYPGLDGLDETGLGGMMKQRGFTFNFNLDAAGRPISIKSIQGGEAKKTVEFKLKADQDASKYEYALDFATNKIERQEKGKRPPQTNQNSPITYYATHEEAIINARYSAVDKDFYKRLESDTSKSMEKHIEGIKEEIKKKEEEFATHKAKLIKEPFLKWIRKAKEAKETKEFEEYLSGQSPTMNKYNEATQALNKYIADHGDKQDEELQLLKAWKDDTSQVEEGKIEEIKTNINEKFRENAKIRNENIDGFIEDKQLEKQSMDLLKNKQAEFRLKKEQEQAPFNQALTQLQSANRDLERHAQQLRQAHQAASQQIQSQPNVDNSKAQAFLKAFDVNEIKKLEEKVDANNAIIKKILNRLAAMGAEKTNQKDQGVAVSDTKPVSQPNGSSVHGVSGTAPQGIGKKFTPTQIDMSDVNDEDMKKDLKETETLLKNNEISLSGNQVKKLKALTNYQIRNYNTLLKTTNSGQGEWLSGKEVNDYMELLQKRADHLHEHENNNNLYPKYQICESNFLERNKKQNAIEGEEYEFPLLKIDPSAEKLLVPLNVNGNHWILLEVDSRKNEFKIYDSLGSQSAKNCKISGATQKLEEEIDLIKNEFDKVAPEKFKGCKDWNVVYNNNLTDDQFALQDDGGNNCGVFACKFAEAIVRNQKLGSKEECDTFMKSLKPERIVDEVVDQLVDEVVDQLPDVNKYPEIRKQMFIELINKSLKTWNQPNP